MATFQLSKDKKGQFRFELLGKNGETIAVSESYKAKPSALKTIAKIKAEAKSAKIVDNTLPKPAAKPAKKAAAKKAPAKKKVVAKKTAAKKPAPALAPAEPVALPVPTAPVGDVATDGVPT
ncbi:MAG: DUF1508 domain-containing protein [Tepidisphaeraceae bacterium]